jgi:hypothetical protein
MFLYNAYILPYIYAVSFSMPLIYAIYSMAVSFCVIRTPERLSLGLQHPVTNGCYNIADGHVLSLISVYQLLT